MNFGKHVNDVDPSESVSALEPLILGQWHHVAAVHRLDELALFIDGVRVNTTSTTTGEVYYHPVDIPALGSRGCYVDTFTFVGLIDELTIYTRALDDAEISDICLADTYGECR